MTEDVSATLRTAVIINLMAGLISAILIMSAVSLAWLSSFQTRYIMSVENSIKVVGRELTLESRISAATAYKYIAEREGSLNAVSITYADGTSTSDFKTLLRNADKYVKFDFEDVDGGLIDVTVVEVN